MRKAGWYVVISCCLFWTACNRGSLFQETRELEQASWEYQDTLQFVVNAQDTINPYNWYVNVRNGANYAYSNLWLFVHYTDPEGTLFRDTVELPLAYPDGRWIGSGVGDVVDNSILFRSGFRFPKSGTYQVTLQHGMRSDTLHELISVGLFIQRAT